MGVQLNVKKLQPLVKLPHAVVRGQRPPIVRLLRTRVVVLGSVCMMHGTLGLLEIKIVAAKVLVGAAHGGLVKDDQ